MMLRADLRTIMTCLIMKSLQCILIRNRFITLALSSMIKWILERSKEREATQA
jgi:hypothetical protein